MLHLKKSTPIALGSHRAVYVHPDDPALCVKVLHEPWKTINRRLNDPFRWIRPRRHYDENRSELSELRLLQRRLGDRMSTHFPQPFGLCETDLGEGLVVEHILGDDQKTALTLKNYLWLYGYDDDCRQALEAFWQFLFRYRVLVRDPLPRNLALARRSTERPNIVMIDGFGSSDLLPFRTWFGPLAQKKIASRRLRTEKAIAREIAAIDRGGSPTPDGMVRSSGEKSFG